MKKKENKIRINQIIKHSSKFSGVALFTKVLGFPKAIILAMVLMPEDYGKFGIATLYASYLGFLSLGNVDAAFREMPGLLKKNKHDEAIFVQNNAFSFDFIIRTLLLSGFIIYGLFQKDIEMQILIVLAGLWYYLIKIRSYQNVQIMSRMEFSFAARIRLIVSVVSFILAISLVFIIGIYALLVPLVISELVAISYQLIKKGKLGFKFQISKDEIIRTSKIGVYLVILSFLYKAFESITSKTIISEYLTEVDLGLFVFALSIVFLGTQLIKDISVVYKPMLWGNADYYLDMKEAFGTVVKVTQLLGLIGGIIIGLIQIGFIIMVTHVTVNFIDSKWIFLILSLSIFTVGIQAPSEFVLTSSRINKQSTTIIIWSVALLINISLSILLIHLGYNIVGVAIALVISQTIASSIMITLASRYFFLKKKFLGILIMFLKISIPFFISIIITIFHWVMIQKYSIIELTFKSILIQLLLWSVYIFILYKKEANTLLNTFRLKQKLPRRHEE